MSEYSNQEKPEVYALRQDAGSWQISRRDFLKTAGIGAAAIGLQSSFVRPASAEDSLDKLCKSAVAHQNKITDLKISPDGQYLFSVDQTYKMKCWDMESHSLLHSAEDKGKASEFDAVGTLEGDPLVYKIKTGGFRAIELPELKAYPDEFSVSLSGVSTIGAVAADPDENLYGVSGKKLFCLRAGNGKPYFSEQNVIYEAQKNLKGLAVIGYGERFFLHYDGGYGLYDADSGSFREFGSNTISFFTVTPDGSGVLLFSPNYTYRLLSLEDGSEIWSHNMQHNFTAAAVTPDGGCGIIVCVDNMVRLINMKDGAVIHQIDTGDSLADAVAVAPDGSQFAVPVGKSILFLSLPDLKILGCPVDLDDMTKDTKGIKITGTDPVSGETITYTLPCGSPIPAGAVCTCNCVAGTYTPPCSCVGNVCSCVGNVCSCVGHTVTYTYHYWHPN